MTAVVTADGTDETAVTADETADGTAETADETVLVASATLPLKNMNAIPNNAIANKIPHTMLIPMDCDAGAGPLSDFGSSAVSSSPIT